MNELQYESLIRELLEDTDTVITIFEGMLIPQRRSSFYGSERFICPAENNTYEIRHFTKDLDEITICDDIPTLKEAVNKLNKLIKS